MVAERQINFRISNRIRDNNIWIVHRPTQPIQDSLNHALINCRSSGITTYSHSFPYIQYILIHN